MNINKFIKMYGRSFNTDEMKLLRTIKKYKWKLNGSIIVPNSDVKNIKIVKKL